MEILAKMGHIRRSFFWSNCIKYMGFHEMYKSHLPLISPDLAYVSASRFLSMVLTVVSSIDCAHS